jgi:hypothetical protein
MDMRNGLSQKKPNQNSPIKRKSNTKLNGGAIKSSPPCPKHNGKTSHLNGHAIVTANSPQTSSISRLSSGLYEKLHYDWPILTFLLYWLLFTIPYMQLVRSILGYRPIYLNTIYDAALITRRSSQSNGRRSLKSQFYDSTLTTTTNNHHIEIETKRVLKTTTTMKTREQEAPIAESESISSTVVETTVKRKKKGKKAKRDQNDSKFGSFQNQENILGSNKLLNEKGTVEILFYFY